MGSKPCGGLGVKLFVGGAIPNIIGFGNLPLLPYLSLWRHILITAYLVISI
jgi:hypothetical protein